jgi:type IV pilus assembly protein PilC
VLSMNKITSARLSLKEQCFFAKRLSFLINAGTPLSESLEVLREQSHGRGLRVVLEQVTREVSGGQSLSKSLAGFPRVFGNFTISLVRVGEASGTLSANLEYLAEELKKRHALRAKVMSALLYPLIISLATLGIVAFLMLYLFPKLLPVFVSLHVELPLVTRVVIGVSHFLSQWGLAAALLCIATVVLFRVLINQNKTARAAFERVLLFLPIVGTMIRSFNIANGCRTLGLLLKSGIRLEEALVITADATHNLLFKKQYRRLSRGVARGEKMSVQLLHTRGLFPDMVTHMVSVGERSGSLPETLIYLSDLYDTEVDEFTKNISTLVEPLLMIVMGILVGFIAIAIITPLYGITQNLHA